MKRTFHLRFTPFGTSFKRPEIALRRAADVPDISVLCDNEIVVDVGGCCFGYREPGATSRKSLIFDHHLMRPDNYPSASAAVLHHAAEIVDLLAAHNEIWIVTHREPDFDALCAVYLVKALLGGTREKQPGKLDPAVLRSYGLGRDGWNDLKDGDGKILTRIDWFNPDIRPSASAGWAVLLTAYASCVDGGKRLHADPPAATFGALRWLPAPSLIIAPTCITVWNRCGMVVACTFAGRAEADSLENQLSEVASVARDRSSIPGRRSSAPGR